MHGISLPLVRKHGSACAIMVNWKSRIRACRQLSQALTLREG
jgi:hypothetical protein